MFLGGLNIADCGIVPDSIDNENEESGTPSHWDNGGAKGKSDTGLHKFQTSLSVSCCWTWVTIGNWAGLPTILSLKQKPQTTMITTYLTL